VNGQNRAGWLVSSATGCQGLVGVTAGCVTHPAEAEAQGQHHPAGKKQSVHGLSEDEDRKKAKPRASPRKISRSSGWGELVDADEIEVLLKTAG